MGPGYLGEMTRMEELNLRSAEFSSKDSPCRPVPVLFLFCFLLGRLGG
jgi:hypothetical protein